jgi:hypothetical protein
MHRLRRQWIRRRARLIGASIEVNAAPPRPLAEVVRNWRRV